MDPPWLGAFLSAAHRKPFGLRRTLPNGPTAFLPRWQLGSSESIKLPSAASTSHCIHSSRGQTGCSASPPQRKVERYISMSECDSARFIHPFQHVDRCTKKEWCQLRLLQSRKGGEQGTCFDGFWVNSRRCNMRQGILPNPSHMDNIDQNTNITSL